MSAKLRVAAAQFSPVFGDVAGNARRLSALLDGAEADLIVCPELCLTGYDFTGPDEAARYAEPADGFSAQVFRSLAVQHSAIIVGGFAESAGGQMFNSCCVVVPETSRTLIYRKTHLFYREKFCFSPGDTGFVTVRDDRRDAQHSAP